LLPDVALRQFGACPIAFDQEIRQREESVKVKCFECAALMEADDCDAVALAFVAHGQARHTWSYPEEAVRNYARNYAEATERLTGATERLSEIADVTVHPASRLEVFTRAAI
jgi:hypothetical protein